MSVVLGTELVRIPLDYYKILGLPLECPSEQIEEAYRDRLLQRPRGEYSDQAMAQRKELLDRAYDLLSNNFNRQQYNEKFFAPAQLEYVSASEIAETDTEETEETEETQGEQVSEPIDVEISQDEIEGALIILLEIGEYENVIKLGLDSLNSQQDPTLRHDLILSVAVAWLEQGKDQWQQREYEMAAHSLNQGRDLLLRFGLLSGLNEEIKIELQKLRPYRILELLAHGEDKITERLKALQLLKQMLQERQGIEGKGEEQSSLEGDNFLRFVQRLQTYLTVAEQQEIFEAEAERPSAVGAYLAFYALLARGFAEKNPLLIVRAQEMLQRLKKRQDMSIEQAVCWLLLGKTQEAIIAAESTTEVEILDFIKENSPGSPDILPGLCTYANRWLQTDVFSHFRDLKQHSASVEEYFADVQVQKYLDTLVLTPEVPEAVVQDTKTTRRKNKFTSTSQPPSVQEIPASPEILTTNSDESLFNILHPGPQEEIPDKVIIAETIRDYQRRNPRRRRPQKESEDMILQPLSDAENEITPSHQSKHKKKLKISPIRLGIVVLGFFGLTGIITALAMQKLFEGKPKPEVKQGIERNQPPQAISTPPTKPVTPPNLAAKPLDRAMAKQLVQKWLEVKSKAFGEDYQMEDLKTVLSDPFLSQARKQAQQLKASNSYRRYQHSVDLPSVKLNPKNPNQATIEATVAENSQFYRAGVLNAAESYNSKLKVRYELLRNNNQWLIKEVKVLP